MQARAAVVRNDSDAVVIGEMVVHHEMGEMTAGHGVFHAGAGLSVLRMWFHSLSHHRTIAFVREGFLGENMAVQW